MFIKEEASVVVANMGNCQFFIKDYNTDAEFEEDWKKIQKKAVNCFRTRGCFNNFKELDLFRDYNKGMCGQMFIDITMETAEHLADLALQYEKKIK